MSEIIDISRTLSTDLSPWPGDTPFEFRLSWKMAEGATVNVAAITTSVHNGTHADAPFHFAEQGSTIDAMPLDVYLGRAVVVEVSARGEISTGDLGAYERQIVDTSRVLFKSGAWPDPRSFPETIAVLASDAIDWLRTRGVKLIGVDVPSVDPLDSKDLRNHHALAAAGIAIIESLDLGAVIPGVYNFAALPLKICGGDAAPVRAVLWRA